ncbi:MAG: S8 family serine peptidase [Oscillospiraceae bacterium]|nr:S8 family serine peptidase [Oscillospiraceae bacterium]
MKRKTILKTLSAILALCLFIGATPSLAADPSRNAPLDYSAFYGAALKEETTKRIADRLSVEDDFSPDGVLVVLKHKNSRVNAAVRQNWFAGLGVAEVRDLTAMDPGSKRMQNTAELAAYEREYEFHQILHLTLENNGKENVIEAIRRLEQLEFVQLAEPVYPIEFFSTTTYEPDDPYYDQQWALENINAPAAWEAYSPYATGVQVAIIDSGISDHEDLIGNINRADGWDFIFDNNLDTSDPYYGHGTAVAGIVGAIGNNETGVCGVAWDVELVPYRFSVSTYFYNLAPQLIAAIQRATAENIPIINASWGYLKSSPGYDENEHDAMFTAISQYTGLMVCAAGNEGNNNDGNTLVTAYPASFDLPHLISVAAINSSNELWVDPPSPYTGLSDASNYGAITVDIAAPGEAIPTTYLNQPYDYNKSGTSLATPHVAGAAALMLAHFPGATPVEIKDAIIATATPTVSLEGKVVSGGRLDVLAAMKYLDGYYTVRFSEKGIKPPVTNPMYLQFPMGYMPDPVFAPMNGSVALPSEIMVYNPGKRFAGWSEVENGTTPIPNPYAPTDNVTLYPVWVDGILPIQPGIVVDDKNHFIYGFPDRITPSQLIGNGTTTGQYLTVPANSGLKMMADSAGEYIGTGYVINLRDYNTDTVTPYTMVLFGDYNGDGEIDNTDVSSCLMMLNVPPPSVTPKTLALSFLETSMDVVVSAPTLETRSAMQRHIYGTEYIDFGMAAISRGLAVFHN